MGRREDFMAAYYAQEERFAQLLNGWIFRGSPHICADQVKDGNIRYLRKRGKRYGVKSGTLYRDVLKEVENVQIRIIVGTEVQTYVDYSMPVRTMDYDTGEYKRQIHRIQRDFQRMNPKKVRLSALDQSDRLAPVITLVLYQVHRFINNCHKSLACFPDCTRSKASA